jgi:hypothetical protein
MRANNRRGCFHQPLAPRGTRQETVQTLSSERARWLRADSLDRQATQLMAEDL